MPAVLPLTVHITADDISKIIRERGSLDDPCKHALRFDVNVAIPTIVLKDLVVKVQDVDAAAVGRSNFQAPRVVPPRQQPQSSTSSSSSQDVYGQRKTHSATLRIAGKHKNDKGEQMLPLSVTISMD